MLDEIKFEVTDWDTAKALAEMYLAVIKVEFNTDTQVWEVTARPATVKDI